MPCSLELLDEVPLEDLLGIDDLGQPIEHWDKISEIPESAAKPKTLDEAFFGFDLDQVFLASNLELLEVRT